MPQQNVKSKSKTRRIKRNNRIFRRRLFEKHLGIKQFEKRSVVTYPVHFPLALYVAHVLYHAKQICLICM